MGVFFFLENHSEPNFRVDLLVEYLNYGEDFSVEYMNYLNGGRIHPIQFCEQTNCWCWSIAILFHEFCSRIFLFELYKRSKNVPLVQQAFGAVLVRYSWLLGGKSARPIWAGGPLLHFSFLFRVVFLVWLVNQWGSSFAFCLFSTNSNSTPASKCLCSFLLLIFPHPPAYPPSAWSISTPMECFRSSLCLFFGLGWLQTGTPTLHSSLLFSSLSLDSQTPPLTPNSKPPLSA